MRKSLCMSAVLLSLTLGQRYAFGQTQFQSAADIVKQCEFARVLTSEAALNRSTAPGGGWCVSLFSRTRDFLGTGNKESMLGICLPRRISIIRMIHLFIQYVEAHPDLQAVRYEDVVNKAMQASFPCKIGSEMYP